jgi:hypothetical protein
MGKAGGPASGPARRGPFGRRNKSLSYTAATAIRFSHAGSRARLRLFHFVQTLTTRRFGRSRRFSGIHVNVAEVVHIVHVVQDGAQAAVFSR